jgi:RNA polymerase sigma-70 factor (ECF subfamily)
MFFALRNRLMSETSASLLDRLRLRPDDASWRRLVDLYTPLIRHWLRRASVPEADADDLVQEVLTAVVAELPRFCYDRDRGSFRAWLRVVTTNRLRAFWRAQHGRPTATGDSAFREQVLDQLADPHSDLSRLWEREHDQHVARRLLALLEPEFEPSTWHAFRRVVLDGLKAAEAAAELGLSVNAVFIAKSRVLRRLRQEMAGLTD